MHRRIHAMPENFINDLRQLLTHLRRSPEAAKDLTPLQREIIQSHRLPLRRFTAHQPRELLSTKRRVGNARVPLAQAIGWLLSDNPKLIEHYVKSIHAH